MDEDWEPDLWAAGASDSDLVSIFAAAQGELIRQLLRTWTVEGRPGR
jgi:hypothetical protein